MTKGVLTALRDSSLLSVDVSELLRRPGATQHLFLTSGMDGLAVEMARVPVGSSLELDLDLDVLVDGIHVSGAVTGVIAEQCARCLRAISEEIRVDLDELFCHPGEGLDDGDTYEITDEHLDLEPLVRDAVILALPLNPLCRPDCTGLCQVCGTDRNEIDCGHATSRVAIRWDALARLRETMED